MGRLFHRMTPQVGAKWETYALQFSHLSLFSLMHEKNINCTASINPFDKILKVPKCENFHRTDFCIFTP
jgi:hypothetical protein